MIVFHFNAEFVPTHQKGTRPRGQIPRYCRATSDLPCQPRPLEPLDPPSEAPQPILVVLIRLLIKDLSNLTTRVKRRETML